MSTLFYLLLILPVGFVMVFAIRLVRAYTVLITLNDEVDHIRMYYRAKSYFWSEFASFFMVVAVLSLRIYFLR